MPEETPSTQPMPSKPLPEKKQPEKGPISKKRKWFKKIPKEFLFSPGGVILLFFALIMEITDLLIPVSGIDSLVIELIPEILFCLMLSMIVKIPFTSQIIPLLIERIPVISDIVPTWLIRMFM